MSVERFVLESKEAVLLVIDIQERLAVVMKEREKVVRNTQHLIELAKMIDLPVVITEQYPKGLGRTLPELQSLLPEVKPVEKISFNCCGEPSFLAEMKRVGRTSVIITGMETHICVLQTTLGLLGEGYQPHVVQDAVCSRTKDNWKTGVELMRNAGAVVTGTETVLFQLLKVAGTDAFKKISQRIK